MARPEYAGSYFDYCKKSYIVEVVDVYGQKVTPDDLRLVFKTYDAAESYAQFYRDSYNVQYKFRVIGVKD